MHSPSRLALILAAMLAAVSVLIADTTTFGAESIAPHAAVAVVPSPTAPAVRTPAPRRRVSVRSALAAVVPAPERVLPACGRGGVAPANYRHVVWIWLENRSYDTVIGGPGICCPPQRAVPQHARGGLRAGDELPQRQPPVAAELLRRGGRHDRRRDVQLRARDLLAAAHPDAVHPAHRRPAASGGPTRSRCPRGVRPGTAAPTSTGTTPRSTSPATASSARPGTCRWARTAAAPLADRAGRRHACRPSASSRPTSARTCTAARPRAGDEWLARWVPRIVHSPGYEAGRHGAVHHLRRGRGRAHVPLCPEHQRCRLPRADRRGVAQRPREGRGQPSCSTTTACSRPPSSCSGSGHYLGHAADADTRSMVAGVRL